ncbi:MFS transporter [Streptomyces noursei]|nr:MFS transporter [Streptomyces noursei]
MIAGLVLAALNLRPAITSLGALLKEVRDGLGMSGTVAGLLTSVPALCFAVFGFAAPRLARRWGPGAIVCAGMAAIGVGVVVRPFAGGTPGFLAGSALALAGIAVSNVLLPVVIKTWFPDRVGSMTGLYSMALALGTSLAAALTVPMTAALGGSWRTGLAVWALLAALAVLPWLAVLRRRPAGVAPGAAGRAPGNRPSGSPRRRPPGRSRSSSASRRPPPTSPWGGCRRSSATPGSRRAPRGCCWPSPWRWACRSPSCCRGLRPGCGTRVPWWSRSACAGWPATPVCGWRRPPVPGAGRC